MKHREMLSSRAAGRIVDLEGNTQLEDCEKEAVSKEDKDVKGLPTREGDDAAEKVAVLHGREANKRRLRDAKRKRGKAHLVDLSDHHLVEGDYEKKGVSTIRKEKKRKVTDLAEGQPKRRSKKPSEGKCTR
jgi:hypothetical protein